MASARNFAGYAMLAQVLATRERNKHRTIPLYSAAVGRVNALLFFILYPCYSLLAI